MLGHGASDGGVQHGGVLEELGVIVAVVEGLKVFEDDGGRQRLTLQVACLGLGLLEDKLGEGGREGREVVVEGPQDSAEPVVLELAAEKEPVDYPFTKFLNKI